MLIDRENSLVFMKLGDTLEERINHYKNQTSLSISEKELDRIRYSTRSGEHYMSEKFRDQIAALLPRRRGRGRPRTRELCCK